MTNKTNQELVALLTNPELKEAAGLQLLQQSPSIDDLKALFCNHVQQQAVWNILKSRGRKEELLGIFFWCDTEDALDVELEEALLKFDDLGHDELQLMMRHGCGKEATWQRLLKLSPDNRTLQLLVAQAQPPYNEIVTEYLLAQPDDNDTLREIVDRGTPKYKLIAWERLKKRQLSSYDLYLLLQSGFEKEILQMIFEDRQVLRDILKSYNLKEKWRDPAVAYLLANHPSKEELLEIVGYSGLWETAWAELLKLGIENDELIDLINHTRFRHMAWEQLKKQSPTFLQLEELFYEDMHVDEELCTEIAAYMLTLNASNEGLRELAFYWPAVKDAVIDRLLQQNPSEDDMKWVRNRSGKRD